jgi:hypothetical protein
MAEQSQITFSHKEVVEALIRKHDIHEGIWAIFMKFGLNGADVGPTPNDVTPTAMVGVLEIGLQRADIENNISVDAARVNPRNIGSSKPRRAIRKR